MSVSCYQFTYLQSQIAFHRLDCINHQISLFHTEASSAFFVYMIVAAVGRRRHRCLLIFEKETQPPRGFFEVLAETFKSRSESNNSAD